MGKLTDPQDKIVYEMVRIHPPNVRYSACLY